MSAWVDSLAVQGDADRFYAELGRFETRIIHDVCERGRAGAVSEVLDGRFRPALLRHLNAGESGVLAGLCEIVRHIDEPEIDPVLDGLYARWLHALRPTRQRPVAAIVKDHELWRAFNALADHPRFERVPRWRTRLEQAFFYFESTWHGEDLLEVLARAAASYAVVEQQLFEELDWQDRMLDRTDRLDRWADALWRRLGKT